MGKRHILALVLMVVVMAAWSLIFGNRMSKQRHEQEMEKQRIAEKDAISGTVDAEGQDPSDSVEVVEPPGPKIPSTPVHVKTDQYEITFAMESATATRWGLKGYPDRSGVEEQSDVKENPINLIPSSAQNWLSLRLFEPSFQDRFEKGQIVWEADKTEIDLTGPDTAEKAAIAFSTQIESRYKVSKTVTVYPNEYFV